MTDEHGHHEGNGHGGDDEGIPPWPHKPVPPEPRRLLPERSMLVRGVGLGLLAAGLGCAGLRLLRRNVLLGAPPALVLVGGAVLAAWAAVIHLSGGERFDDHPWV